MITIDVVLNCNHSLFNNYINKFREMETQKEHINQIERNLESHSALVLIFKKGFLFYIRQYEASNSSKIYLFIKKLSQLKTIGLPTTSA